MNGDIIANPLNSGTDALEHYALEECVKRRRLGPDISVLITPASRCETGIKLARLGARVTIADEPERRRDIEGRILAAGLRDEIGFLPLDQLDADGELPGQPYDIILIRRGLCALPYGDARQQVRKQLLKLKIGGKLYVSVLGMHSELGDGYPASERPIDQRFAPLAPEVAAKYSHHEPVCLYSERNLFMLLLEAGASVLRTLTTTYGNVQGVAVRV